MIQQAIAFYRTQLKDIDRRIAEVLDQTPELAEKSQILESCPGVGKATIGSSDAQAAKHTQRHAQRKKSWREAELANAQN